MVNPLVVALILVDTMIGSLGSLIIKKGSMKFPFLQMWKTWHLYVGVGFYGISVLIYMVILPLENLTVIYPLVATSYIWTTILAVRYLDEKMNVWKYVGLMGILVGVSFIALGA